MNNDNYTEEEEFFRSLRDDSESSDTTELMQLMNDNDGTVSRKVLREVRSHPEKYGFDSGEDITMDSIQEMYRRDMEHCDVYDTTDEDDDVFMSRQVADIPDDDVEDENFSFHSDPVEGEPEIDSSSEESFVVSLMGEEDDDTAEEHVDNPPSTKKDVSLKKLRIIGSVVVAVVVVVLAIFFGYRHFAYAQVPHAPEMVAGETSQEVCQQFEDSGLTCSVEKKADKDKLNGELIEQSLQAGDTVKKGSKVVLTYSKGPETGVMPDLSGKELDEAKEWLIGHGLVIEKIDTTDDSTLDKDRVVSLSINPDSEFKNGDKVSLVVSAGKIIAPDWGGKDKEAIEAHAKELGIDVSFVEQESDGAPGMFISQTPAAGEKITDKKMTVTISKQAKVVKIKIPDVIGKKKDEVTTALVTAGLSKITVVNVKNNDVTEEKVTQIVPEVDSEVDSDSNVTVIVSSPVK